MAHTKDKKKILIFSPMRMLLFTVILAVLLSSLFFSKPIEKMLHLHNSYATVLDAEGMKIHFIDVGQGDATLIELPDGKHMLVDTGAPKEKSKFEGYLTKVFQNKENVIDYFILTHPHDDHYGNMIFLFSEFTVKEVYRPKVLIAGETVDTGVYPSWSTWRVDTNKSYVNAINAIAADVVYFNDRSQRIEDEDAGYKLDFYGPTQEFYSSAQTNNYSPVLVLSYNGKTVCLTGDAEAAEEKRAVSGFLHGQTFPQIDIYHMGHHGSNTSSSIEFLEKMQPQFVIISVGVGNIYKHPDQKALERVQAYTTRILRTDKNGTIIFGISKTAGKSIAFEVAGESTVFDDIEWYMIVIALIPIAFGLVFTLKVKK